MANVITPVLIQLQLKTGLKMVTSVLHKMIDFLLPLGL
jgi:hypothetical protein